MISCVYLADFAAWAFTYPSPVPAPVAVVSGGRVVAATPTARLGGVDVGMTPERACMLLPSVRICQRDAGLEQAVWEDVLGEVNARTPFLESAPPVVFFKAGEHEARELARGLRVPAGSAPHRSYALLAALSTPPGTLMAVEPQRVTGLLKSFPTGRLPQLGFSGDTARHLKLLGLRTLDAVRRLDEKRIRGQLRDEGARLHALLYPQDGPQVAAFTPPPVVAESYEFECPAREPHELVPVLERVTRRAAGALGGLVTQRIRLSLTPHRKAEAVFACRVLPGPTESASRLLSTAKTLLCTLLSQRLEVDTLTVELGGLRHPLHPQLSLFDAAPPQLLLALESILSKYEGAFVRFRTDPHAVLHEDEQRAEPLTIDDLRPKPARRRR